MLRALSLLTLTTALAGVVASTASAAINDPPVAPRSFLIFPVRDFVSLDGYSPGQSVTVQVIRDGAVIGIDHATADSAGLVEINHPAAAGEPQNCWEGTTPDIRDGDIVRALTSPTDGDQAITQAVHVTQPATLVGNDIVVKGTAQDVLTGAPLPVDQLEQRMVANKQVFDLNGRRTLRADAVGGGDGTLSYDPIGPDNPKGINWTAVYTGLDSADQTRAVNAESRLLWLGPDPAAAVPSTNTIDEFGQIPGPSAPCTAPLAQGPSTPAMTAATDSGASSSDAITNNTRPVFTGITGSVGAGARVNLYDNPGFPNAPVLIGTGTATAVGFGTAGYTLSPTAALSEGTHAISVSEVDPATGAETFSGSTLAIMIDTTAPAAPSGLTSTPSGGSTDVQISGVTEDRSTVKLFTDATCTAAAVASGSAADFSGAGIPVTLAAGSTVTFSATATDLAGNASGCSIDTVSYSTLDTIPPTVTIDEAPADPTSLSAASFAFSADEDATFDCDVDGDATLGCTSPYTDAGLADGTHTFTITATDAAGNAGSASYTWTIDTTPVHVALTSTPPRASRSTTPTFAFSADKAGVRFDCSLVLSGSAPSFSACTSPKTYAARADGNWMFQVRATDAAGNANTASYGFAVDGQAPIVATPVASLLAPDAVGAAIPVKVAWSATDASGAISYRLQLSDNGGAFANVALAKSTATSARLLLLPGHTYRFQVQATDGTGNASAFIAGTSLRVGFAQETSRNIAYSRGWSAGAPLAGASGGSVRSSSTVGARATYSFTGRGIALVTTKGRNRGKVAVSIDGRPATIVDLYSTSTSTRQVVFAANGLAAGSHTIRITVAKKRTASSGNRVDLDAFAVLA